MSNSVQPPSSPDDDALYGAAADEYIDTSAPKEDEDDDGDSSSGEGGDAGLKSKNLYDVILDTLLDFANDDALTEEENEKKKLKNLDVSPMSTLVSGASSFASENDLSRKVFMSKIGLVNFEIKPRDIADPKLFSVLDKKQAERRAYFGIRTLDEIVSGAIGAAGLMVGAITASVNDFVKDKREERRVEKQIRSYEGGEETYSLDSEEFNEAKSSMRQADFPVQDNQDEDLMDRMRQIMGVDNDEDDAVEVSSVRRPALIHSPQSRDFSLPNLFNALVHLVVSEPLKTITLPQGVEIGPSDDLIPH